MSTEQPRPAGSDDRAPRASAWHRFLTWSNAIAEAMDTSYDEIQDRRILALEGEVIRLGKLLDGKSVDA